MIRPVELHGMVQRTQDISTLKQNENNKPMFDQQALQVKHEKETMHQAQQYPTPCSVEYTW